MQIDDLTKLPSDGNQETEGLGKAPATQANTQTAITYKSANHSEDDLDAAADLVNSGGQLTIRMDAHRIGRLPVVILAKSGEDVIGVAAIKGKKPIGELGYLVVTEDHRRKGIAKKMTQLRISRAKSRGYEAIYASVRAENKASAANLKASGFELLGSNKSPYSSNILEYWVMFFDEDEREGNEVFLRHRFNLNDD